MKPSNINRDFLDAIIAGRSVDAYYHLGLSSDDDVVAAIGDLTAVVMAGSGERIRSFAETWSRLNGAAPVLAVRKEDRFVTRYCAGVLFVSHGMGMASASIALQETMRLAYFVHGGDLDALDAMFWCRVGTSGGIGVEPGTVVVSTEAVMADLRPFRVLRGADGEHVFESGFPAATVDALASHRSDDFTIATGRTACTNEFFLEQYRLDGAIRLDDEAGKQARLQWLAANDVVNIEMEGALFAAYLNHWGFSEFAMVCVTLLDRLRGDQVTAAPEVLSRFAERAGEVVFSHLSGRSHPRGTR